uniref:Uncharacterized protein n=1 Tax=Paramoeba aestuarina TaxID=180227 RepID=A0A7S4L664_9EUKA|mmetsp:Transcript_32118/g.50273  ORF Transcript_32118/g.50273 Transcript_32118/m.50273 type:complete len:281 (+) Transcript_32118:70-912(+)
MERSRRILCQLGQDLFSQSSEDIKKSFVCLLAHHAKSGSESTGTASLVTSGNTTNHNWPHVNDIPAAPARKKFVSSATPLDSAVSALVDVLKEYVTSLEPTSASASQKLKPSKLNSLKAAVQMLLLTATNDLYSLCLYMRRVEGITTILGSSHTSDFLKVWSTWEQWWRDANHLQAEKLLESRRRNIYAQSPIEAYVHRYKSPILSCRVESVVRKIKDDFYLTSGVPHAERSARRELKRRMKETQRTRSQERARRRSRKSHKSLWSDQSNHEYRESSHCS